jgi:hypothetical protein
MRWIFILLLFITTTALAETGSGERLAQPPVIVLTQAWLYNQPVPVYQVTVEHAGEHAELQAAEAAVASVHNEFKNFSTQFVQALNHYIVGRTDQGNQTTIYIHRSIIADWLIMS